MALEIYNNMKKNREHFFSLHTNLLNFRKQWFILKHDYKEHKKTHKSSYNVFSIKMTTTKH